ncbi:MAG: hypothetical protein KKE16_01085 [Firmicutes bacterium]|nr:hypothetical protein [Bacillota bacterium]
MPNITNKDCFSYSRKNGGTCDCLKDQLASCDNCSFFKDKEDIDNNHQMDLYFNWLRLPQSTRQKGFTKLN